MAIPKKGSRKIVVEGVEYRWRIRWKPSRFTMDYFRKGLSAAVELYNEPQGVLLITFPWSSYKHYPTMEVESVTPKNIENAIINAIDQGWKPTQKGLFEVRENKV